MGGAAAIHAAAHRTAQDVVIDGLILLDPALETRSALANGVWAESGMPPFLLAGSAQAAVSFYGLPDGSSSALATGATLDVPILLIQDPDDPVTTVQFARDLAARNTNVRLWEAPTIDAHHADIAWKGRWGSHVAAFDIHPEQTIAELMSFIHSLTQ